MTDFGSQRRRRRVALLSLGSILLGILIVFGWPTDPPAARPRPPLPWPNGYDDLIAAAGQISGDSRDTILVDVEAGLAAARTFVAANSTAFATLRLGLSKDCVIPFAETDAGYGELVADLNRLQSLSDILLVDARVGEADGRISDAARSCRDLLTLGRAAMTAGSGYGDMIQGRGMDQIRRLRGKLSAEDCRAILRDLEAIDRRPPSLLEVADRIEAWDLGPTDPFRRIARRMSGQQQRDRQDWLARAKRDFDRADLQRRLLFVELAITAHHRERGTWPRSLGGLVPGYLPAVPIDPRTGRLLDYPKEPTGELLRGFARIPPS